MDERRTSVQVGRLELYVDFKEVLKERIYVMVAGVFNECVSFLPTGALNVSYLAGNF